MPDTHDTAQTTRELGERYADDIIALRCHFHQHPELSAQEHATSDYICAHLDELGIPYERIVGPRPEGKRDERDEFIGTGIIATIRGEAPDAYDANGQPAKRVALRCDMDALPVAEKTELPFASQNDGVMHACGHDCHMAMQLGAARILMDMRNQLHGEVRLIFQPAEEGVRGAYAIVENGWLDDVDVLLASHIAPTGQADDGDVTVGTWGSLATTKYDAVFTGRAAHAGGFPEQGKNALLAAASAALALHAIPRHSGGQSFVNVGTLRAGSGRNVVPDHALMQVEVRGETTEINRFMMARTEEICRGAAAMQGCACSLTVMGTAEGQHSDLALIERIGAVIRRDLPGLTLSTEQNAKNWGSDDVSVMMNRVQAHGGQAAYMRAMADMAGAQHTVTFDFDEAVLGKSVAVFCAAAMALMEEEA